MTAIIRRPLAVHLFTVTPIIDHLYLKGKTGIKCLLYANELNISTFIDFTLICIFFEVLNFEFIYWFFGGSNPTVVRQIAKRTKTLLGGVSTKSRQPCSHSILLSPRIALMIPLIPPRLASRDSATPKLLVSTDLFQVRNCVSLKYKFQDSNDLNR